MISARSRIHRRNSDHRRVRTISFHDPEGFGHTNLPMGPWPFGEVRRLVTRKRADQPEPRRTNADPGFGQMRDPI